MELIEKFIQAKTGRMEDCEDTFFVNEHYVAVIDGATNVSGRLFHDKTPGQLAATTIKKAISNLNGKKSIGEIIKVINEAYKVLFNELGIEKEILNTPYIRPSAAMILFSRHHRNIWMIGDCQCSFNQTNYQNIKRVDEVFEEVRSIIVKGELIQGRSKEEILKNDIGFELIRPLIRKQYNFQNASPDCSLSYAVVNGFQIPDELIKTVDVPEDVEYISFGSDGYPKIYETLEETETHLQKLLKIDPLCIHENIGTKGINENNVSFDDRTYIKVRI